MSAARTGSNVCVQEPATTANSQVQALLARARVAQAAFESFSQEQVDAVKGIGKYVYDNADLLAHMAVDETRCDVQLDRDQTIVTACRSIDVPSKSIVIDAAWRSVFVTAHARAAISMSFRTWSALLCVADTVMANAEK